MRRYAFTRCIRLVLPLPAMPMTIATVGLDAEGEPEAEGDAPEEGRPPSAPTRPRRGRPPRRVRTSPPRDPPPRAAGGDAIEALTGREAPGKRDRPSARESRAVRARASRTRGPSPRTRSRGSRVRTTMQTECARDEQVMRRSSTRRVVQLVLW